MSLDHPARIASEGAVYVGALTYPVWVQWFDSSEAHAVTWLAGLVAIVLLGYCRVLDARNKKLDERIKLAQLRRIEGGP